jgi:AraC-like DNA-binding protein
MTATRVPDDVLVHLRRVRDHADRRFADQLTLEQLAAVAGVSKWHFQRLFTSVYGVSPAAYVSRRRIERA